MSNFINFALTWISLIGGIYIGTCAKATYQTHQITPWKFWTASIAFVAVVVTIAICNAVNEGRRRRRQNSNL